MHSIVPELKIKRFVCVDAVFHKRYASPCDAEDVFGIICIVCVAILVAGGAIAFVIAVCFWPVATKVPFPEPCRRVASLLECFTNGDFVSAKNT